MKPWASNGEAEKMAKERKKAAEDFDKEFLNKKTRGKGEGKAASEHMDMVDESRKGVDAKKKIKAERPTEPKPADDPGPGKVWAWDSEKMAWFQADASTG